MSEPELVVGDRVRVSYEWFARLYEADDTCYGSVNAGETGVILSTQPPFDRGEPPGLVLVSLDRPLRSQTWVDASRLRRLGALEALVHLGKTL
mgnify:FL=1